MPTLALHGFTGCGEDFTPFATLCGDALPLPYQCPDLPGHGSGGPLDCSPESTVRFIEEWLVQRFDPADASPSVALGYSMGARATLLHAVAHPERWDRLVLISGNPGIPDAKERAARVAADRDLADSLKRMGLASFLDFWQETPLIRSQKRIPPKWREPMLLNRRRHTADGLANSLREFGQGSCPDLWPELRRLTMPVCLITGERDTKYTEIASQMVKQLPNPRSRHFVVESASHMPHLEQAEATVEAVLQFLQSFPT